MDEWCEAPPAEDQLDAAFLDEVAVALAPLALPDAALPLAAA